MILRATVWNISRFHLLKCAAFLIDDSQKESLCLGLWYYQFKKTHVILRRFVSDICVSVYVPTYSMLWLGIRVSCTAINSNKSRDTLPDTLSSLTKQWPFDWTYSLIPLFLYSLKTKRDLIKTLSSAVSLMFSKVSSDDNPNPNRDVSSYPVPNFLQVPL